LKHMGVPQVVSGDAESMLKWLPMQRAMDLVDTAMQRAGQGALTQSTPDALADGAQGTDDQGTGQGTGQGTDQGTDQNGDTA
ncbi:hypothetical protein, partial [Streptomyces odontomachi]|uniref:hypothetical protein n=1 Tax=Streptomyces odontomachi TaxID=2944940 RepID=UPI00210DB4BC